MIYVLVEFDYGSPVTTGYAEYDNGLNRLERYTDLSGNTLIFECDYGGKVINPEPEFPSWGTP